MKILLSFIFSVFFFSAFSQIPHRIIILNGVSIDLTVNGTYTIPSSGAAFTLTTSGSSGAATYSGGVLNIPIYSSGSSYTNGYGLNLSSLIFSVDSTNISTWGYRKKGTDSIASWANSTFYPLSNPSGYISSAVTSVATGYGLTGGIITTTGTLKADSNLISSWQYRRKGTDSVAGLIPSLSGYATTAALNDTAINIRSYDATNLADTSFILKGLLSDTSFVLRALIPIEINDTAVVIRNQTNINLTDTATSIRSFATTSINDTAISIRTYDATNLTDTSIARALTAQTNLIDTASALRTTINTRLSSISITSGNNISVSGSTSTFTVTATPTNGVSQIQYNKSNISFASASKSLIDSADGTNIFITQSYTTVPTNVNPGLYKIISDSLYGFEQLLGISSATGLQSPYQTMSAHHFTGTLTTNGTTNEMTGFYTSALTISGTPSYITKTYDGTNCAPNFMMIKTPTSASANSSSEWYFSFANRDAMINNNNFGGGSLLTVNLSFPVYFSTERIFIGYANTTTTLTTNLNPSEQLNLVGVCKDTADNTLQIVFNNGSNPSTKVNTGITPNQNDEYRVTVWIPSNTTIEYVTLERFTKSTLTIFGASNTTKIPLVSTMMYMHVMVNTGLGGSAVSSGINWIEDSQYEY